MKLRGDQVLDFVTRQMRDWNLVRTNFSPPWKNYACKNSGHENRRLGKKSSTREDQKATFQTLINFNRNQKANFAKKWWKRVLFFFYFIQSFFLSLPSSSSIWLFWPVGCSVVIVFAPLLYGKVILHRQHKNWQKQFQTDASEESSSLEVVYQNSKGIFSYFLFSRKKVRKLRVLDKFSIWLQIIFTMRVTSKCLKNWVSRQNHRYSENPF